MFDKRRIRSFKVVCQYIGSVHDREVRDSKHLSRSQSSPSCQVANYSSDTINRLIFINKIKVEIGQKILLHATHTHTKNCTL